MSDPAALERQRRIVLAAWAYAYEIDGNEVVDDARFDALAYLIDLGQGTGDDAMDEWWRANFQPYTGTWIHHHPDLPGVERVVRRMRGRA